MVPSSIVVIMFASWRTFFFVYVLQRSAAYCRNTEYVLKTLPHWVQAIWLQTFIIMSITICGALFYRLKLYSMFAIMHTAWQFNELLKYKIFHKSSRTVITVKSIPYDGKVGLFLLILLWLRCSPMTPEMFWCKEKGFWTFSQPHWKRHKITVAKLLFNPLPNTCECDTPWSYVAFQWLPRCYDARKSGWNLPNCRGLEFPKVTFGFFEREKRKTKYFCFSPFLRVRHAPRGLYSTQELWNL